MICNIVEKGWHNVVYYHKKKNQIIEEIEIYIDRHKDRIASITVEFFEDDIYIIFNRDEGCFIISVAVGLRETNDEAFIDLISDTVMATANSRKFLCLCVGDRRAKTFVAKFQ
jgi:hypothetical protein